MQNPAPHFFKLILYILYKFFFNSYKYILYPKPRYYKRKNYALCIINMNSLLTRGNLMYAS